MPPKAVQKLKVLFLHGFTQNASRFRAKTGGTASCRAEFDASTLQQSTLLPVTAIRKVIKGCSLHTFMDAPFTLDSTFGADFDEGHWLTRLLREEGDADAEASPSGLLSWFWFDSLAHMGGTGNALAAVHAMNRAEGPFDCILGFSQGAAVAAAYASYLNGSHPPTAWPVQTQEDGDSPTLPAPEPELAQALRAVILVGGFKRPGIAMGPPGDSLDAGDSASSPSAAAAAADAGSGAVSLLPVASLHITGAGDDIIPPAMSLRVAAFFQGADSNAATDAGSAEGEHRSTATVQGVPHGHRILTHPGGHYVPTTKPVRDAIRAFLRDVQAAANAAKSDAK